MKHSPAIELRNAQVEFNFRETQCPHWDREGGPYEDEYGLADCCYALLEARNRLRLARIRVQKENTK